MKLSIFFVMVVAGWAGAEQTECDDSCHSVMDEYQQCMNEPDFQNCLCSESSRGSWYLNQCLLCGDAAWQQFGRALAIPMQKCGRALPAPVPGDARVRQQQEEEHAANVMMSQYVQRAKAMVAHAEDVDRKAQDYEAHSSWKDAKTARETAARVRNAAKHMLTKLG